MIATNIVEALGSQQMLPKLLLKLWWFPVLIVKLKSKLKLEY